MILQQDVEIESESKFKPDYEVLSRFAESFEATFSMKKTHLHLVSRVNWHLFCRYLDWLTSMDYISVKNNAHGGIYVVTHEGKEMFRSVQKFKQYVSG